MWAAALRRLRRRGSDAGMSTKRVAALAVSHPHVSLYPWAEPRR